MAGDQAAFVARYEEFVRVICESNEVWGLRSPEKNFWCIAESNHAHGRDVMPFWPDRASALRCAKDNWSKLVPDAIPLDRFVDRWLPGMASDEVLVGANWNEKLAGLEVEPDELRKELVKSLDFARVE
jgi:hypothetical protein